MSIQTVMVIGAGQMGGGIAQVMATAGRKTYLNDVNLDIVNSRIAFIEKLLTKDVSKGKITEEQKAATLANLIPSDDQKDAADCDLVVEAIVENLEIKGKVFKNLDEICNPNVLRQLYETMDLLDQNDAVRVVILTGAGEKAFVAGADIASMSTMTPEEAMDFAKAGHQTMDRIAAMKKVTIAAINGFALGGGCELAMACDIRIASTKARMGIPEVSLGVIPGFGGTQRLPRLVGLGMAMELLATGRQVKADEAKEIGLVNRVTEPEGLLPTCMKIALQIAENSAAAITLGKQVVHSGLETDLNHGLELEQRTFALTFATTDQQEGMSAFLEKRPPNFS